ncbi:MAG: M48 family metalloprotease [Hyphomicrobiales bacterium]|nr:M48 family metalloprotease [Hyphomicrobiales bacterium]
MARPTRIAGERSRKPCCGRARNGRDRGNARQPRGNARPDLPQFRAGPLARPLALVFQIKQAHTGRAARCGRSGRQAVAHARPDRLAARAANGDCHARPDRTGRCAGAASKRACRRRAKGRRAKGLSSILAKTEPVISVRALVAAVALAAALSGCSTIDQQAVLGPPQQLPQATPAAPPQAPRTVGVDPLTAAEHKRLVAQFGGEYRWPAAENYLNAILVRLAAASDNPSAPYRVTILNSPIVNAFALPSGNLYISRGLLALANDSSEVAAVMAHEIGHVSAHHAAARAEQEKRAAVIQQAAHVIQSRQKGEEVEATQRLSFASFSRQQEIDADRIGVKVIAAAGFDPYGASRFLAQLGRSTALSAAVFGQPSADRPNILATHPSTPERIQQATLAARQIGAPGIGKSDRTGYLAAIDGMAFGEDPAEGVARGRRFFNTRQQIAFTAPEGFVLEIAPNALLGRRPDGSEALRVDSVPTPAGSLESYLSSGWLDGLVQSSIEKGVVGGMNALFATTRAGEWNFRVALVQDGDTLYRIMFAVRALNEDAERRFRASIDSFHRMSADEIAKAKSLRLRIVTAGLTDSAESMARKSAVSDRPLETFLVLNGLDAGAKLSFGEKYKIVVE